MKQVPLTLLAASILWGSLSTGGLASSTTPRTEGSKVIPQLEQQAQRLDWEAQTTKGAPRAERQLQRLRVKRLIERLQAGEAVDPREIDTLLKEQPWPR